MSSHDEPPMPISAPLPAALDHRGARDVASKRVGVRKALLLPIHAGLIASLQDL